MQPVEGGTQPIKMGQKKSKRERDSEARMAMQQHAVANSFVMGQQSVFAEGAADPVKGSRTEYGNINYLPQDALLGSGPINNFAQDDAPGNMPPYNPIPQTGDLSLQTSMGMFPNTDPETFESEQLNARMMGIQQGIQYPGLNDRASLYTV